ncbi:phytanoyl-CoA dioxygenase family protein [Sphingomonas sp. H39-1-10]|uniref:phytanoyl-CoA dioxygenase family protein n=1 Tax=Sphingomonas pollutisoli TaxID=3030829 RepID=UPI0023B941BA|nr:phytanoyl-CoA dioxygenase family protein [Sphingomonas pollutisoli]MDF0488142.1 phytanoyl-CoA dioxygenase family protein [Sphingomonas pollutisoli]
MVSADNLSLERHGAERLDCAALPILSHLLALADTLAAERAGTRLHGIPALTALLAPDAALGHLAGVRLGPRARSVRAILFDKTADTNWALGWHQDRVIAVRERIDTPGYGPWSVKQGMLHVAPPAALLAGMLTMRVHLDAVPATNAPLLVAPGTHRLGRIAEDRIEAVVADHGSVACLADAGDVWLYATPILHGSAAAAEPGRRRVFQVDFAACDLPSGLRWLGV